MNNKRKKFEIEKNLIDFYLSFKNEGGIDFYENEFIYSINNANNYWPNFILNKNNKIDFDTIVSSVLSKDVSKNWLLNESFSIKNETKIKKARLFPVKNWNGMLLQTTKLIEEKKIEGFKVEKLKVKDLDAFIEIINTIVFKKDVLNIALFTSKINDPNFNFFIGKYNNQIVSTCLIFDNGTTNGLYFLATKSEFRGKGFGKLIITKAINHQIKNKKNTFVLHGTKIGHNIYTKIGFDTYSKLIIFVKI